MKLPLEGIKVVDLSRTLAGPYATMLLGDLGADIIKIEEPTQGDESRRFTPPKWNDESCYFLATNRNKRSITLNLKSPEAIEIVKQLIKDADVVVENFKTGTMEKFGLGYDVIKEINPKIVMCSISGFGRTGPEKYRPGYDILLQAYGGQMSITGTKDEPAKVGMSLADLNTGMFAAFSIVSALYLARETGKGQYLDVSMFDGQVSLLNHLATGFIATGEKIERMGTSHPSICPYQAFKAKDQEIIIAVANDGLWVKMCKAFGWEDLLIEKYETNYKRVLCRDELVPILAERFAQMTVKEIMEVLDAASVPCGPINSIQQVIEHPITQAREMIWEIEHPTVPGLKVPAFPVKFSETPAQVRKHPPLLGEHTKEVLANLGYSEEEIEKMRAEQII